VLQGWRSALMGVRVRTVGALGTESARDHDLQEVYARSIASPRDLLRHACSSTSRRDFNGQRDGLRLPEGGFVDPLRGRQGARPARSTPLDPEVLSPMTPRTIRAARFAASPRSRRYPRGGSVRDGRRLGSCRRNGAVTSPTSRRRRSCAGRARAARRDGAGRSVPARGARAAAGTGPRAPAQGRAPGTRTPWSSGASPTVAAGGAAARYRQARHAHHPEGVRSITTRWRARAWRAPG
jgi:hypothetical protein